MRSLLNESMAVERARRIAEPRPTDPLPGLSAEGDACTLLSAVTDRFPWHSQTVDFLAEALTNRSEQAAIPYQFFPNVGSYLTFVKTHQKNALYLVIHPERNAGRFVSIGRQDDEDGPLGWSWSNLDQLIRGNNCPAVNFTMIHGLGFSRQVADGLQKAPGAHWIGGRAAMDVVVDGRTIHPLRPRDGDGTSDATMVVSLPITQIHDGRPDYPYTITNANWPSGWQIYGIPGVSAEDRKQVRRFDLEVIPLTPSQIRQQIETEQSFLNRASAELDTLLTPGNYPMMKEYVKEEKINAARERIGELNVSISRLQHSLANPNIIITYADLGIQIWR